MMVRRNSNTVNIESRPNTMEPFAIPRAVITSLKEKAESLYQHGSSSLWLSRHGPLPRVESRRPIVCWNVYWKLTHLQA